MDQLLRQSVLPESIDDALALNVSVITILVSLGTVVATIRKYIETVFPLAETSPKTLVTSAILGAWYFGVNMAQVATSFTPANDLQALYRASFIFAAVTMVLGPFLIVTPTRPIALKKQTLFRAIVVGAQKKETRYTVFAVFILLTALQGFVVFSLYQVMVVEFAVELRLAVGIIVGYSLVCIFYLVIFYSVMLRKEIVIKGVNVLQSIRKGIRFRRSGGKAPLDLLAAKWYVSTYLALYVLAGLVSLLLLYFAYADEFAGFSALPTLGKVLFVGFLGADVAFMISTTVFVFNVAFHPLNTSTEVVLDDGRIISIDKIKWVGIARSSDATLLAKYATPLDPHKALVEAVVEDRLPVAVKMAGHREVTSHAPWGTLYQENDERCMFFLATGQGYPSLVANKALFDIQMAVAERYYGPLSLAGLASVPKGGWTLGLGQFFVETLTEYNNKDNLTNLEREANDWAARRSDQLGDEFAFAQDTASNLAQTSKTLDVASMALNKESNAESAALMRGFTEKAMTAWVDRSPVPSLAAAPAPPKPKLEKAGFIGDDVLLEEDLDEDDSEEEEASEGEDSATNEMLFGSSLDFAPKAKPKGAPPLRFAGFGGGGYGGGGGGGGAVSGARRERSRSKAGGRVGSSRRGRGAAPPTGRGGRGPGRGGSGRKSGRARARAGKALPSKKSEAAPADEEGAKVAALEQQLKELENQRMTLASSGLVLEESKDKVAKARNVVAETEAIGTSILADLESQKSQISRASEKLKEVDISSAFRVLPEPELKRAMAEPEPELEKEAAEAAVQAVAISPPPPAAPRRGPPMGGLPPPEAGGAPPPPPARAAPAPGAAAPPPPVPAPDAAAAPPKVVEEKKKRSKAKKSRPKLDAAEARPPPPAAPAASAAAAAPPPPAPEEAMDLWSRQIAVPAADSEERERRASPTPTALPPSDEPSLADLIALGKSQRKASVIPIAQLQQQQAMTPKLEELRKPSVSALDGLLADITDQMAIAEEISAPLAGINEEDVLDDADLEAELAELEADDYDFDADARFNFGAPETPDIPLEIADRLEVVSGKKAPAKKPPAKPVPQRRRQAARPTREGVLSIQPESIYPPKTAPPVASIAVVEDLAAHIASLESLEGVTPPGLGPSTLSSAHASPALALTDGSTTVAMAKGVDLAKSGPVTGFFHKSTTVRALFSPSGVMPPKIPADDTGAAGKAIFATGNTVAFLDTPRAGPTVVVGNRPIPRTWPTFYFEVTISNASSGAPLPVGIGLVPFGAPLNEWPGQNSNGGYSYAGSPVAVNGFDGKGNDRGLAISPTGPREYGKAFGRGATIGCGVDFAAGIVWYTLNGQFQGVANSDIRSDYGKDRHLFVPAAISSSSDPKVEIEFNFGIGTGARPFKFKGATTRWASASTAVPVSMGAFVMEVEVMDNAEDDPSPADGPRPSNLSARKIAGSEPTMPRVQAAIGWSLTATAPVGAAPGGNDFTFGFGSLNGERATAGKVTPYGPRWGTGDVVSAFVDVDQGHIAYAKNGEYLGVAHRFPANSPMYPVVSVATHTTKLKVRFFPIGAPGEDVRYPDAFGAPRWGHPFIPYGKTLVHSFESAKFEAIRVEPVVNYALATSSDMSRVLKSGSSVFQEAHSALLPLMRRVVAGGSALTPVQQLFVSSTVRVGLMKLRAMASSAGLGTFLPVLQPIEATGFEGGVDNAALHIDGVSAGRSLGPQRMSRHVQGADPLGPVFGSVAVTTNVGMIGLIPTAVASDKLEDAALSLSSSRQADLAAYSLWRIALYSLHWMRAADPGTARVHLSAAYAAVQAPFAWEKAPNDTVGQLRSGLSTWLGTLIKALAANPRNAGPNEMLGPGAYPEKPITVKGALGEQDLPVAEIAPAEGEALSQVRFKGLGNLPSRRPNIPQRPNHSRRESSTGAPAALRAGSLGRHGRPTAGSRDHRLSVGAISSSHLAGHAFPFSPFIGRAKPARSSQASVDPVKPPPPVPSDPVPSDPVPSDAAPAAPDAPAPPQSGDGA